MLAAGREGGWHTGLKDAKFLQGAWMDVGLILCGMVVGVWPYLAEIS